MADAVDTQESIIERISSDEYDLSPYQQLISRLNEFKNLSVSTRESKKQLWLQFLSVWCEVLAIPASKCPSCYNECASLLPVMIKAIDFYSIRNDIRIARETCFLCINQLDQIRIRNYFSLTKEEQELAENKIYFKHIYYLLMFAAETESFLPFDTLHDQQIIENYLELFRLMIERVDKRMPEQSSTGIENNYSIGTINERILTFLWNLTDRTVLIPMLLKCNLARQVIGWLSQASMLREKSRRSFIGIIHNIARHDDGADQLNNYDATIIIKRYQNMKLETTDSRILLTSMALALVSTPEQLKRDKKGMNSVLNQLLQLVMDASKGARCRHDGLHVSEPLCILVKMFVVEERTLDYILCHAETEPPSDMISTISLFISLFMKFSKALKQTDRLDQYTLIAILNVLWSISFQRNYQQELIKNDQFIQTIQIMLENSEQENIIEQYKPRSMEGIQQATQGILHNLNFNPIENNNNNNMPEQQNISINTTTKEVDTKPWTMVSYCHANNEFCSEIYKLLSTCNNDFNIWIDRTHCQGAGDLWESIADGMEQSTVIICLLSNQYFQSKSCRQEFIYAVDSLKRTIVPVLIENFEPKGWLGIRMTGMKYVRFRDINHLEQNKKNELLHTILLSLSSSSSSKAKIQETRPLPSSSLSVRPSDDCTSNIQDIHSWFSSHRISTQIRDLFDFQTREEMLDYAQLLTKDRDNQMNIYAKIYFDKHQGKEMPPHEFLRFAKALEQLSNDTIASTHPRSTTCTIS